MALRPSLRIVFASTLALLLAPSVALAHWCDDLWDSSYNIVVKPASDSVTVPDSGSATLDLYVQNNMGYALSDFQFRAEPADSTYNITSVRTVPKVSGYLMPGETLKYTLTISKAGGATLDVTTLQFYVNFGDKAPGYSQRQDWPYQARPVMMKKHSGGLFPSSITQVTSQINGNHQADYLQNAANADYYDLSDGLDRLLEEIDPPYTSGTGSIQYDSLWAAAELAVRKGNLGSRLSTLRTNLKTTYEGSGYQNNLTFKAFSSFVLGYLGPDSTTQTFLEGKLSGTADEVAFARAALCVMGVSTHCGSLSLTANSEQAQMVAAAALRITGDQSDDAGVESELIARARFTYFDDDDGKALMAAHLLNLVAWEQRGWAVGAGDTGPVSFYPENANTESGQGGGGTGSTKGGCGFGAGGGASLLAILLIFAARRRKT